MSSASPHRFAIEGEDRARLQRLTEEVEGRVHEIAAICARVAGIKLDRDSRRKFLPEITVAGTHIEIIDLPTDPPSAACIIQDEHHYCVEVPCGG
jgi:hypothetical protein